MATRELNKIFLSASIPYLGKEKDAVYYETADIIAIRDAVRALATVIIPNAHLVWGGHPSITPMIRYVMQRMDVNIFEYVTLYQSLYFKDKFPVENETFENIVLTKNVNNSIIESLALMRSKMIRDNDFKAGVFIGGMDGIEVEYSLFREHHPKATVLPIASTGAASKMLYDKLQMDDNRLVNNYTYMALFKEVLSDLI